MHNNVLKINKNSVTNLFERSDETLIKNALTGKRRAWCQLVKRHEQDVYNYALRMVSHRADAFDLMQDIFMSVFRNLASFQGRSQFKTWLFKIAHYRCIEYYRRKKDIGSLDDEPMQVAEHKDSCPEYHFNHDQQASTLMQAMQTLPVNERAIVELKFFQHFTFAEISGQLGLPVNTVKSKLYRALDKLKLKLEIEYV